MQVGGGRELALGQAVAAVVLDHVDQAQVATTGMLELTHADVCRVAVAADPDVSQAAGWPSRAGGHRRHPAVQCVEAVAVLQEIRGRLARAADPTELDGLVQG